MTAYRAQVDGHEATILITPQGLDLPDRSIPWHAVDTMADDGPRIVLGVAEGVDGEPTRVEIGHLGSHRDAIAEKMREARGSARRASLGQADLAVVEEFESRDGGDVIDIAALPHGIVVEPRGRVAAFVPWGLVSDVSRDGHSFTLMLRYGVPVRIGGLGRRTDEFAGVVARLRGELTAAVRGAARSWDAADLPWEDGWALDDPAAVNAWLGRLPQDDAAVLREACSSMRAGLYTEGGSGDVPFVLGRLGESRVLVEGVGEEDRATFVFSSGDLDRVNAALLAVSFRRELLALPAGELGRWSAAIRTQPEAAWLRSALQARIIHDDHWSERLRTGAR